MNTLKFKILLSTVCFIITSSLYAFTSINCKDKSSINSSLQLEKDALIALYNSAGGANWTNTTQGKGVWPINDPNAVVTGWNPVTNTGWYGVTVYANGSVGGLSLNNNNLIGEIPNEISNLSLLNKINLSFNKLSGNIPFGLFSLSELLWINLESNVLTGSIPDNFDNLTKLEILYLYSNKLSGSIPSSISKASSLRLFNVGTNKLTGSIPFSIGNLQELTNLNLSQNLLTGSIPKEIGLLTKLGILSLSVNQLTGEIPLEFGNLTNLSFLDLKNNKLNAINFPIENLTKLSILELNNNNFTGNLPSGLSTLTSLKHINVSSNLFANVLPDLTNLTLLKYINIAMNKFRFVDFENQFSFLNASNNNFIYSTQSKVDTSRTVTVPLGNTYTMTMYEDGRQNNENYQWYKGIYPAGQPIVGETSRSYIIQNVSINNNGDYYCLSTHSTITIPSINNKNLILVKEPIKLLAINCPPPPTGNILTSKLAYCIGEKVALSFQFDTPPSTTFSYNWSYVNGNNSNQSQINTPTFSFNNTGLYTINLVLTDANGCTSNFSKQIVIEDCTSCLHTNNQSNNVKSLFVNLINHLKSLSSVPNGYNCPELVALSPYITDPNPRIYNFSGSSPMKFSFADHGTQGDVQIAFGTQLENIYFHNYTGPDILSNYYTESTNGSFYHNGRNYIKHINFCPSDPCSTPINGTVVANNTAMRKSASQNISAKLPVIEACVNQATMFTFQTSSTNLTYNWEFKDSNGNVIQTSNVAQPSVVFQNVGYYRISLNVSDVNGCTNSFGYGLNIVDCNPVSCTENNPNFINGKTAFINLLNKLISLSPSQVIQGYTCPELVAFAPYIIDANPAIYNFSISNGVMMFSFADHGSFTNDVSIYLAPTFVLPIQDVSMGYISNNEGYFNVIDANGVSFGSDSNWYQHINFCASDGIRCERHIAIVVDESGSIDEIEARKIRSQLRSFVNKQLDDNNDVSLNTDVRISLIGLSDSDSDTRTNASIPNNGNNVILNERISSNNIAQYIAWIDGYRKKYEVTPGNPNTEHRYRVSPNSDYWNSGLTKAADLNPDFVILITDGCQTALPSTNAGSLLKTMQRFNNNNGATTGSAGKPHLFVVGIEDGFYVDSDIATSKARTLSPDEDPNFNSELSKTASATAKVSSFLRTSLKYLMAYPSSQFPIMDKYYFLDDYYGADDFNFLYDEPNYLSNGLIARSFSVNNGETTLVYPVGMSCGAIIPLEGCDDCLNFKPEIGKKYIVSAWVKEEINKQVMSYTNPTIQVNYLDGAKISIGTEDCITSGDIIDGWQRIFKQISIPGNTAYIEIALVNNSQSIPVYFDDVRIHPIDGSMKSFVYDPETFRLMSELDENNYSTFYEYDNEGGLVRVKKETSRGIKTIQETRSGNVIKAE
ncbi:PKD domain-containing protein [Flavobacterium sp.]|uniref:PKD domain-containing protein n=1 Tax=Flavobacterium sp. TaxID=239 RepID=UPI004047EC63